MLNLNKVQNRNIVGSGGIGHCYAQTRCTSSPTSHKCYCVSKISEWQWSRHSTTLHSSSMNASVCRVSLVQADSRTQTFKPLLCVWYLLIAHRPNRPKVCREGSNLLRGLLGVGNLVFQLVAKSTPPNQHLPWQFQCYFWDPLPNLPPTPPTASQQASAQCCFQKACSRVEFPVHGAAEQKDEQG